MAANPYERVLRKVSDPLRDETRKVRKTLLVWSLAAAAMTLGHLFPSEITALGLQVTPSSRSVLLDLMVTIVGYHVVSFITYASSDFAHWYVNHKSTDWEDDVANYDTYKAELLFKTKLSEEDRHFMEEHERRLGAIWRGEASRVYRRVKVAIPFISVSRALVDFVLPLVAGAVAVYLLVVR